ncbi:insulinase family protein, partial [Spirochaetota bacterium]
YDMVKRILDYIKKIPGVLDEKTVKEAQFKIISDYLNNLNITAGLAYNLSSSEATMSDPFFDIHYLDSIKKISCKDISYVIHKYFRKENTTEIFFLPEDHRKKTESAHQKLPPKKMEKVKLQNSSTLLIKHEVKNPILNAVVVMRGGLEHENKEHMGIFNMMTKMLLEGNAEYTKEKMHSVIESQGGKIRAFSGYNSFGLIVNFLKNQEKDIYAILRSILTKPHFSKKNLAIVKNKIKESMEIDKENIWAQMELEFKKNAYKGHPYSFNKKGSHKSIDTLTTQNLLSYYKKFIVSENLIFSVSGDINIPLLKKELNMIPHNRFSQKTQEHTLIPLKHKNVISGKIDKEQTAYRVAFRTCRLGDEKAKYFDLLDSYLSGMGGPLFRIRESTGNSYQVGSYNHMYKDTGIFVFFINTGSHVQSNDNWILEQFLKSIYTIKKGKISNKDVERAYNNLIGGKDIEMQSPINITLNTALYELYGVGYNHYFKEYDLLEKNTDILKKKLIAVISSFFNNTNFIFLKLSKKNGDS